MKRNHSAAALGPPERPTRSQTNSGLTLARLGIWYR